MSIFNAILDAIAGVSEDSYDLGLPHEVGDFDRSFKNRMSEFVQLPASVGEEDVVASAEAASSAEAQKFLLQNYSQNMQRVVRAEAGIYGIRANYGQAMMGVNQQLRKVDLRHSKMTAQDRVNGRSSQAEARGWENQFTQTRSRIRL